MVSSAPKNPISGSIHSASAAVSRAVTIIPANRVTVKHISAWILTPLPRATPMATAPPIPNRIPMLMIIDHSGITHESAAVPFAPTDCPTHTMSTVLYIEHIMALPNAENKYLKYSLLIFVFKRSITFSFQKKPDEIIGRTRHLIRHCNCDYIPSDV